MQIVPNQLTFTLTVTIAGQDAPAVAAHLAGDIAAGALDLAVLQLIRSHLAHIEDDRDWRIVAAELRPAGEVTP